MSTKRNYYQIRYSLFKEINNNFEFNYYIIDYNHYKHSYNNLNEKNVIEKVRELQKMNPYDTYWYTKIEEHDKFVDQLENGCISID